MNRISEWLWRRSKYHHPNLIEWKDKNGGIKTERYFFKTRRDASKIAYSQKSYLNSLYAKFLKHFKSRVRELDSDIELEIKGDFKVTSKVYCPDIKRTKEEPYHYWTFSLNQFFIGNRISLEILFYKETKDGVAYHKEEMTDMHIFTSLKRNETPFKLPLEMIFKDINEEISNRKNNDKNSIGEKLEK